MCLHEIVKGNEQNGNSLIINCVSIDLLLQTHIKCFLLIWDNKDIYFHYVWKNNKYCTYVYDKLKAPQFDCVCICRRKANISTYIFVASGFPNWKYIFNDLVEK